MVPDLRCFHLNKVSLKGLPKASEAIIDFGRNYDIWIFKGEMGSGKTTLINAICKVFGVVDNVHSPTYSLVNEYRDISDRVFYHFDFYRINDELEASELGTEEYFHSGATCFVEWPSKIPSLIPQKHFEISILHDADGTREIDMIRHD